MTIIGLTGGIGSGKSTVASYFQRLGIVCVDADLIARDIVRKGQPALAQLVTKFGSDILDTEGNLNRVILRKIIFEDESNRLWVNQLMHPLIRSEMLVQCHQAKSPYVILMVPLLFENNLNSLVSRVLVIDTDETTQIVRTTLRDNVPKQQVTAIISSQINRAERLKKADDIIENHLDTSVKKLEEQVLILHNKYLELCQIENSMPNL